MSIIKQDYGVLSSDNFLPRSEANILCAKNLLPNDANTTTDNGITFTVNSDGTITASGTATADAGIVVRARASGTFLQNGVSYILSGCPSDGAMDKYYIYLSPSVDPVLVDTGYGAHFTADTVTNTYTCSVIVKSGQTVSNVVFKPMIRLATDPDDTYEPYAMTNRELTEKLPNSNGWVTVNSALKYKKVNGIVYINLNHSAASTSWTTLATLPEGCRPAGVGLSDPTYYACMNDALTGLSIAKIYGNGQMQTKATTGTGCGGFFSFPAI